MDPDGRRSAAAGITDRAPRQALAEHEKARSRDHLKKLIRPVASPYPMLVNIAITAKFYTDATVEDMRAAMEATAPREIEAIG